MRGKRQCLTHRKYINSTRTYTKIPRVVALPLSAYIDGHVDSAEALFSRLSILPLPSTWVINNSTSTPISICKAFFWKFTTEG